MSAFRHKPYLPTLTGNPNGGLLTDYAITPVNGSWSIATAPIPATMHANDKTYDGTNTEPNTNICSLSGVLPTDGGSVSCMPNNDGLPVHVSGPMKVFGEVPVASYAGWPSEGA